MKSSNDNLRQLLSGLQSIAASNNEWSQWQPCLSLTVCAFWMFHGCLSDTFGYYVMNNVWTTMNCLGKGKSVYNENKMYMLCLLHIETVYVGGNLYKYWHW